MLVGHLKYWWIDK